MSDFKSVSSHSIQQTTIPAANGNAASWRQVFKRAFEQSTGIPGWRGHRRSHSSGELRIFMQTLLTRKYSIVALLLVVLGAFVAFVIIRYATRRVAVKQVQSTVASGKSLLGLSRSTKPKPAPGKPFVPETQTHLPIPTVWIPSPQSPQLPS